MAKDMRNGTILLLLLCNIAFSISQFRFGDTTTHSFYSNNNNVTCIESERIALLEFKGSLIDNAFRLASWTTGEDCCNWAGITCNSHTGHVQKLHLRNPIQSYSDEYDYKKNDFDSYQKNSLGGGINSSILNLEHLTYLDLSCNDFSGIQIPMFLGSLKNLRYLNLSNAGFASEIPSHLGNLSYLQYLDLGASFSISAKSLNWISGLTSLKALDLSNTDLTNCVDCLYSIGMIPSLSSLSLSSCGIVGDTTLSLCLRNLTSLRVLNLSLNKFGGKIPSEVDYLKQLTTLDLSVNQFNCSIPSSFGQLSKLEYLDLSNNQLAGKVPSTLGQLTKLQKLDLSNNLLAGELSEIHFEKLESLKYLSLSHNFLSITVRSKWTPPFQLQIIRMDFVFLGSQFPPWLQTQRYVVELSMNNASISGVIPTWFTSWSSINTLYLSDNKINGSLIPFPPNIHTLDLSNNFLIGDISLHTFCNLSSLRALSLANNQLTGRIPLCFGNLSSLVYLSLTNNQLTGRIPWCFENLSSLESLSLANNQLTGTIPSCFGNLSSLLYYLSLENNQLTGRIPSSFGNLSSLIYLSLENNQLTGRIPLSFEYLSSLECLYLANNQLTGKIPLCFGNVSPLLRLSLANNQLTGRIPLCFGNLRGLEVLDLSNNSFSGHIPSTLGNLTLLWVLHLSRNMLSGVLPSSLKNLKSLRTLDFGENQLTGTIPEWIGEEFSSLQFLRLESNNFYGNISMSLCQLSFLRILNLAQNNLDGHIPRCFDNLTVMRSKDAYAPLVVFAYYSDTLRNVMKGLELAYPSLILNHAKFISLSANNLQGEIPKELMDLEGLQSLNLSNNNLSGRIPENIGKLKNLESLDFAMNQLSGTIPQSLANIDTLSYLNLSFNNLAGRIPSGSHFDTLNVDPSIYEGNSGLCGKPLPKSCPADADAGTSKGEGPAVDENVDEGFELFWFYAGIAPGFAVGAVGVFCILYFQKSWALWRFVFAMFGLRN